MISLYLDKTKVTFLSVANLKYYCKYNNTCCVYSITSHYFPVVSYDLDFSAVVCQGKKVRMRCPYDYSLKVTSAMYGRHLVSVCNYEERPSAAVTTMCDFTSVMGVVKAMCDKKEMCEFTVNSDMLGDDCPDVNKYLKVSYLCQRK